jgi:hypothetical protein
MLYQSENRLLQQSVAMGYSGLVLSLLLALGSLGVEPDMVLSHLSLAWHGLGRSSITFMPWRTFLVCIMGVRNRGWMASKNGLSLQREGTRCTWYGSVLACGKAL